MLLINTNKLIVGRLNNDIAGSMQLSFNPSNNEAQKNYRKNTVSLCCSMGKGLRFAKAMIDFAVAKSKENAKNSIQLDIRETQTAAIQLFESKGFVKWEKILRMPILMETL